MYNRYIPNANGTYERKIVPSPPKTAKPPPVREQTPPPPPPIQQQSCTQTKGLLPSIQLDSGDLLVLLILLLILTEGEETDTLSLLVTLGAFLLLQ